MHNLCVVIPPSLEAALKNVVARQTSSLDSIVTAALSAYFQTSHRVFQVLTSAALVQGVYQGAVSSRVLLSKGNFGLGTFEHLDGEMVVLDGKIYRCAATEAFS